MIFSSLQCKSVLEIVLRPSVLSSRVLPQTVNVKLTVLFPQKIEIYFNKALFLKLIYRKNVFQIRVKILVQYHKVDFMSLKDEL